jgi:uncharacterized protein YbjT (DUF2867 family)
MTRQVLVTGATGYIGGRLVPRLLAHGHRVRCVARNPRKLDARPWVHDDGVDVVQADVGDVDAMTAALQGCHAAYYLVHSMAVAGDEFSDLDRRLARAFAEAAARAGVARIVYLGGLGETGEGLSEHLASRREVEQELASTSVPVTVLRAAVILGSGSVSFEILRYLVERLPVMVTPRWVRTENQPIAVRDVLYYLVACLDASETVGRTLDVGGPEVVTYRTMMQTMARSLGLGSRWVIPVPVLTPRLSSLWIHLVTPIPAALAQPLAEGLRNRVVCRDDEAQQLMPHRLLTVREAIDAALANVSTGHVETAWSDAGVMPGDPDWAGGTVFEDRRTIEVAAPPEHLWRAVIRVGGGQGYYAANFLWRLRGAMDRLVGGPGLRRGRRDPEHVAYGDALDFWRVCGVEEGRQLDLRAEMKVPGEALLSFEVRPHAREPARSQLVQTARFAPRGLFGLVYWYLVLPLHAIVFGGMLRGIRRAAEAGASAS